MRVAVVVARILLGLPLAALGGSRLLDLFPIAEYPSARANELMQAFWETGYLMEIVCTAHLVTGVLLIFGRFVPFALTLHAPITVQMVLFHVFLDIPSGIDSDQAVQDAENLVGVRRQQREDWFAFGLFFLLLGGADAFVAAHLADFPEPLETVIRPLPNMGVELGFRLAF